VTVANIQTISYRLLNRTAGFLSKGRKFPISISGLSLPYWGGRKFSV
jgi:hypothetical protein